MRSNWSGGHSSSSGFAYTNPHSSMLPTTSDNTYHFPSSSSSFMSVLARNKRVVLLTTLVVVGVVLFFYAMPAGWRTQSKDGDASGRGMEGRWRPPSYPSEDGTRADSIDCRYASQEAFLKYSEKSNEFRIAIIADMDTASKSTEGKKWRSVMKKGILHRDPATRKYTVTWKDEYDVFSALNEAGRGMELSDLTYFNGNLLTFDDRTGLVFKVIEKDLIPWRILMDGNGKNTKGMKCEWATVKDGVLYVGSTGKEWTTGQGVFVNNNPLWVKTIDKFGNVGHEDWLDVYTKLRAATNTKMPGYLLHEAVRWNSLYRRWYFIPRRSSELAYNEEDDESRGTNLILSLDEDFTDIQVMKIGDVVPTHGFSAFQFVPFHDREVIALRTEEHQGKIASYIMAFDLDGKVLLEEEVIGDVKFEGIEFI
eukprot:TRINITY_DN1824_c0_g1_i1.p1 TRINITY_DN1824_c0_g1~~TRINITY_DN1824_c0_g1_i1.p1  ORF type:complete len:423 (+),score=82.09 TRINITY_DN1824_c0_g1_i1:169-1437(+)